ncbi:DNA-binding protein [Alicyclobacillus fastidiosus]|uniref:DNA-binding protein n=1 Tax=Alicyclobacillus fastidiosus TaxID=392011 RepID=A0ABV5ALT7_9BACL|nr:DNA-binding protein [Alicyclobacillus fastidiosus]WEH08212.1 DNA-binding protein [Alicyclobacillus fastidiosus]
MKETTIRNLDDIPVVFDCKKLAEILGVSTFTARTIMHQPGFPVVIAGPRRHRIYKPAFLQWIEEQAKAGIK